jgi:hypothetical protein
MPATPAQDHVGVKTFNEVVEGFYSPHPISESQPDALACTFKVDATTAPAIGAKTVLIKFSISTICQTAIAQKNYPPRSSRNLRKQ